MNSLEERLLQLIVAKAPEARRFKELESLTGVTANRWQSVWHKRQRPMPDMIEAAARAWPEHAFWLATGVTDNEFSHTAPDGSSPLDTATESRPAGVELLRLRCELDQLMRSEKRTLKDRWEDWLTEQQERNRQKYPWAFSVHPALAKRKVEQRDQSKERPEKIRELVDRIDGARRKRLAEFFAIHDRQED